MTLSDEERYHALGEISTQLMRHSAEVDDWVETIYTEVERLRRNTEEWKDKGFQEKWKSVREKAQAVRTSKKHIEQATNMLTHKTGWSTPEFVEHVLNPLLRPSRFTWDQLRHAQRADISPLETMQRACERMVRRLEGEFFNEGSLTPTGTDVKEGLKLQLTGLDMGRIAALGRKNLIWDEKYSLVWRDDVPKGAAQAIEDQLRASGARKVQELSNSPSQPNTEGSQLTPNKRKKDVNYEGQQGPAAPKTPKRKRVPAGQGSATKREKSLSELTEVLQGLAVVAEEKQAKRVSSGAQNEAPTYIPNPIAQPNETERAFWELTQAKVRGIAMKQPVSVAKEVGEKIHETSPEQVLAAFKALAEAAKKKNLNDTNSTAYLQSSVDMGTLYLRVGSERSETMEDIRRVARDWRMAFNYNIIQVTPGHPREGGIRLSLDDLEHLLVDGGRDGWLNGEVIEAALRLRARTLNPSAFVMPAAVWTTYVTMGYQLSNLPSIPETVRDIYIPVHMAGSHWGLAYFNLDRRQMVWLDSMEGAFMTRKQAFTMMRRFLVSTPILHTTGLWMESEERSVQQSNGIDCGIFAIENGYALMAGGTRAEEFNPFASRRGMAHELWDTAARHNPPGRVQYARGATSPAQGIDMREVKGPATPPKFGAVGTGSGTPENGKIDGLVDEMAAWAGEKRSPSQQGQGTSASVASSPLSSAPPSIASHQGSPETPSRSGPVTRSVEPGGNPPGGTASRRLNHPAGRGFLGRWNRGRGQGRGLGG